MCLWNWGGLGGASSSFKLHESCCIHVTVLPGMGKNKKRLGNGLPTSLLCHHHHHAIVMGLQAFTGLREQEVSWPWQAEWWVGHKTTYNICTNFMSKLPVYFWDFPPSQAQYGAIVLDTNMTIPLLVISSSTSARFHYPQTLIILHVTILSSVQLIYGNSDSLASTGSTALYHHHGLH